MKQNATQPAVDFLFLKTSVFVISIPILIGREIYIHSRFKDFFSGNAIVKMTDMIELSTLRSLREIS